jgi:multiphosphoryl transfer protein
MEQANSSKLALLAPLSGCLVPIERVPDPVFSQKLVGDGVALDPVSQSLKAPCQGRVTMLHPAHHALTLEVEGGLELLLHVGLDTVNLKGQGFTPRVKTGDCVAAGDTLIDFDADFIATHAKSLLTMIVVSNPSAVKSWKPSCGSVVQGQDVALELELAVAAVDERQPRSDGTPCTSQPIVLPNPNGLHARPAAVLASAANTYRSDVWLECGNRRANAKSVTALMALDVHCGDTTNLVAQGSDAGQAIESLCALMHAGLGEETALAQTPARCRLAEATHPAVAAHSEDPAVLVGVSASTGMVVGNTCRLHRQALGVEETAQDPDAELQRLATAIDQAKHQLHVLQAQLGNQADTSQAAIFAAHQEVLDDPELLDRVRNEIGKGKSAAFAWQVVVDTEANDLAQISNPLLAARATDIRDVGERVVQALTGRGPHALDVPVETILIADELTPSDMANLDRSRVLGVCMALGSTTSHAAIIARSLDIPVVAGVGPRALEIPDGTPVILDATRGTLRLNPSAEDLSRTKLHHQRCAAQRRDNLENAHRPAIMLDQFQIEVVANIGGASDARSAMAVGAEGVGLLRTEFLFQDRDAAPTEDQQVELYSEIARTVGRNQPLVIRTLDVGGDKPLPYLPMDREDNPFLGERGVRVGLNRPELLRTQLRAILRAADLAKVSVMFPMVATMAEWRAARSMFDDELSGLGVAPVPLGIMVEIPSAALMSDQFAQEAAFFSIGTNDLTQYTLAMDRGNPRLAAQVDALNPAVLELIRRTVEGGQKHRRWTGVCGGVASDPQAIPLLIGLGVTELSVPVPAIPAVKAQIRTLNMAECRKLAQHALGLETAAQVRALATDPWA